MVWRSGRFIDLIWVHLNMTHSRAQDVLDRMITKVAQQLPGAVLSINRNISNTQAVIKLPATEGGFTGELSDPMRAAIIRIYTEADHHEALAMVTTVEWAGPSGEV